MADSALQFDGTQNYLNLGTMGNFGSSLASGFYMKFLLKTTQTTSGGWGYYWAYPASHTGASISFNRNGANAQVTGAVSVGLNDPSNRYLISTSTSVNFYDGAWHQFEVTVDVTAKTIVLLFDNVSQGITYDFQDTLSGFDNFQGNFDIGTHNDSGSLQRYFAATVDKLLLGTSATNLYGSYSFNEGTGIVARDDTQFGNTGTLTGSPVPSWVSGTNSTPGNSFRSIKVGSGMSRSEGAT